MTITVTPVTLPDLTTAALAGTGVFDVLMRSMKAHLESEFNKNRIKGPEYSTVYLGSLQAVLNSSLQFLLQKDKATLEAELVKAQIALAAQQLLNSQAELALLQAQVLKVPAEIAQLQAQTLLTGQQKANLIAEALNIPKQGQMIDAQRAVAVQQALNLTAEALNIPKQGQLIDAQREMSAQQTLKAVQETLHVVSQTTLTDKEALQTVQKTVNAVQERLVLIATECKLKAEFDLLVLTKDKTVQETQLMLWKVNTEKAETLALGVDDNSIVGKKKTLYGAQASGFTRDAEQKAADLLVGTWKTRRTTDEATVADGTNLLNDVTVGRAVTKLLSGINA